MTKKRHFLHHYQKSQEFALLGLFCCLFGLVYRLLAEVHLLELVAEAV